MSDFKHTPEPWEIFNVYASLAPGINSKNGDSVLLWKHKDDASLTGLYGNVEQTQANAERIVACVNHCKGATNEELQAASHEQLKAQRDELLAALELAQQIILDQNAGYKHERQQIASLIAKAKGGQP